MLECALMENVKQFISNNKGMIKDVSEITSVLTIVVIILLLIAGEKASAINLVMLLNIPVFIRAKLNNYK